MIPRITLYHYEGEIESAKMVFPTSGRVYGLTKYPRFDGSHFWEVTLHDFISSPLASRSTYRGAKEEIYRFEEMMVSA